MPTPTDGYHLKDGTQVPRTTAIIDAFDPKFGLRDWIWNQGKLGIDYKAVRDTAGGVGTAVHAMIRAHIKGIPGPTLEWEALSLLEAQAASSAFLGFQGWVEKKKIEWLETETELVSEEYRYGGTLDAVGIMEERLVIFDWKTSAYVYASHVLQLAAYRQLWNENRKRPVDEALLVRFDRKTGAFEPYPFPYLNAAWKKFVALRAAYDEIPLVETALKEAKRCMKLSRSRVLYSGDST